MVNSKVHIFFPKDESTFFLESIIEHLVITIDNEKLKIYRPSNRDEHSDFFDYIHEIPKDDLIVFLGHGTSVTLAGASTREYENPTWITHSQLSVFKEMRVLLLSCSSNEYLENHAEDCGLKAGIGFPFLLTDLDEMIDSNNTEYLSGEIVGSDIELFKHTITKVIKESLEDYLITELSFYLFYKRIKLRLNKELLIANKNQYERESVHSQMIRNMRDKMFLIGL